MDRCSEIEPLVCLPAALREHRDALRHVAACERCATQVTDHAVWRAILAAYVDEYVEGLRSANLDGPGWAGLDLHVRGCPGCRREVGEQLRVGASVPARRRARAMSRAGGRSRQHRS